MVGAARALADTQLVYAYLVARLDNDTESLLGSERRAVASKDLINVILLGFLPATLLT